VRSSCLEKDFSWVSRRSFPLALNFTPYAAAAKTRHLRLKHFGVMAQGLTIRQESTIAHKSLRISDDMFAIFEKYLDSSHLVSAEDAARAVDELAPRGGKEQIEDFLWNTWNDVFQIAQQIPYSSDAQQRLLLVVKELAGLKNGEEEIDWHDLPRIGWVIRDWFNFPPTKKHAESESADDIMSAWVNINTFWARLYGTGSHIAVNIAVWTLRQALEDRETEIPKLLDCYVLTATQYINHSGHRLHQLLDRGWRPKEDEMKMYKGGPLYDGEPGLDEKRWRFWASRFQAVAEKVPSQDTKSAARFAAQLMDDWQNGRRTVETS
jgi:hypothetical protein